MDTKQFSDELKKRRLATGMSLSQRRNQIIKKATPLRTKSPKGIGVGWGG